MGDGDGWAACDKGHRHWGRHGAAGLLLYHLGPEPHVLLQKRARLSIGGGTWGLLGGAVHSHEDAITGALREASEESTLDPSVVRVHGLIGEHHGGWSYETVIGSVAERVDVRRASFETADVAWVHVEKVTDRRLFGPFAAAWPRLRRAMVRPVLIVDGPAVLAVSGGGPPDGTGTEDAATGGGATDDDDAGPPPAPDDGSPHDDRTAFLRRLRDRLAALGGVADLPGTAADISYPDVVLLVDGPAGLLRSVPGVHVVARGDAGHGGHLGRDGLGDPLTAGVPHEHRVVVTSHPALRDRAVSAGVPVISPQTLLTHLRGRPAASTAPVSGPGH